MKKRTPTDFEKKSAERIRFLINEYCDGKQQAFAEKTGIGKASVSQYVNETNFPNNITCGVIAKKFAVDPAWVMGFDVPMKPNKMIFIADKQTIEDAKKNAIKTFEILNEVRSTLDIEEASLIDVYRHLDDEGKKFIEKAIKHEQVRMRQIEEANNADNTVYAAHPTANPDAGDSDFVENDQEDMNKEWD